MRSLAKRQIFAFDPSMSHIFYLKEHQRHLCCFLHGHLLMESILPNSCYNSRRNAWVFVTLTIMFSIKWLYLTAIFRSINMYLHVNKFFLRIGSWTSLSFCGKIFTIWERKPTLVKLGYNKLWLWESVRYSLDIVISVKLSVVKLLFGTTNIVFGINANLLSPNLAVYLHKIHVY